MINKEVVAELSEFIKNHTIDLGWKTNEINLLEWYANNTNKPISTVEELFKNDK